MEMPLPKDTRKVRSVKGSAERKSLKHAGKKDELARSTLAALGRLGYARAGLRDIAAQTGVSLGVIHYYFADKNDLVSHAIKLYKMGFVADLDILMAKGQADGNLREALAEGLLFSIENDAHIHRLWYDFREQSMFDAVFQEDVLLVEASLTALLERYMSSEDQARIEPLQLYIAMDGVFRYYLHRKLMGEIDWQTSYMTAMNRVLTGFLGGQSPSTKSLDNATATHV